MRKVIAASYVTLDGFIVGLNEDMSWVSNNPDEEMKKEEIIDGQSTVDTLLLGRVTYELWSGYWPNKNGDVNPAAEHINHTPKIVFSKTLETAPWGKWNNAKVVKDNITEKIQNLKHQSGNDMMIWGSASIVQTFTNLGLIDEYRLLVCPVVLGSGKPLFENINDRVNLKLVKSKTFKNGVVSLYYQPGKKP
ncbi:dihydrofolate reductase family protein [Paenibacillus sp. GP183]|uniref:dihydrofolate reductase family protein n=1 Tax=Paenibacillus sp. GP183 TaxID=1882751 RepID=UPI0008994497|nr:dihydrofolate reductase family protein [Paenibacillus sp. GP183]SEC60642.1 Dihydrofolate reductase [Paenibacillus sp. GP183]